jgi:hypothetical protein
MLLGRIDWQSDDCLGPSTDTRKKTQISAEGREARAYTEQSKFTDAQVRKGDPVTIKAPAIVAHFDYHRAGVVRHDDFDPGGAGVFDNIADQLAYRPKKNLLDLVLQRFWHHVELHVASEPVFGPHLSR